MTRMRPEVPSVDGQKSIPLPAKLVQGYAHFCGKRLKEEQGRFRHLADEGQNPPVLLIGCCDSRVSPEVIFDAGPGEIFVVRNIAALVPPFTVDAQRQETAAAIEYAVIALRVAHIVVMGHAQCGGIRAYAQGQDQEFEPLSQANFVGKWKTLIQPAAERIGPPSGDFDHYCESLSYASIIQGIANLRTYPWLKALEDEGKLTLHGAYFGVANGKMTALDEATGRFLPVAPPAR
jgi:carbonic anhydrase